MYGVPGQKAQRTLQVIDTLSTGLRPLDSEVRIGGAASAGELRNRDTSLEKTLAGRHFRMVFSG